MWERIKKGEDYKQQMILAVGQGDWQTAFKWLQKIYEVEIQAGRISPERQQLLNSLMRELGQMLQADSDKLTDIIGKIGRTQELFPRILEALATPSIITPPSEGQAKRLFQLHQEMIKYVANEGIQQLADKEREIISGLKSDLVNARHTIANLKSDTDAYVHEQESLRQLALEVRHYSLRHHLTLVNPIWASPVVQQNPNAIFFSGSESIRQRLADICTDKRLMLLQPLTGKEYAQARWEQLQKCHVAIFDFTQYVPPKDYHKIDLNEAAQTAAVAYELGIALVLGRPIVVVTKKGQFPPFDVDIPPVILFQDNHDSERLFEAIDEAIYGRQRGSSDSSILQTLTYLQEQFWKRPNSDSRLILDQIDERVVNDPIQVSRMIGYALSLGGSGMPQIRYPALPGSYPQTGDSRCFHVTAYRPYWANETQKIISESCKQFDVRYIRGDKVLTPNVIRSIWDEICQASHIVVDLTHLTANASLELGIAHTLSRNVLLIIQDKEFNGQFFSAVEKFFPSLRKLRVHPYSLLDLRGEKSLSQILARFLRSQ